MPYAFGILNLCMVVYIHGMLQVKTNNNKKISFGKFSSLNLVDRRICLCGLLTDTQGWVVTE
jgi:hypothetical protein